MAFDRIQRTTRRRSSAGPTPPRRPLGGNYDRASGHRQGARPTFLALKDHGKVFVADMPFLSDGQLANITKEAAEVLESEVIPLDAMGWTPVTWMEQYCFLRQTHLVL